MRKSNRIGIDLLDDNFKTLLNAAAKIFPMSQSDIDANLNPNAHEYAKVGRKIYMWLDDQWQYVVADDPEIYFNEILERPSAYPPANHGHLEADIGDLNKYSKEETDALLAEKADVTTLNAVMGAKVDRVAGKDLSTNDFTDDFKNKLIGLSNEAGYDYSSMKQDFDSHTGDLASHVTPEEKDSWGAKVDTTTLTNALSSKADKSYVDQGLAGKVESTTFSGHTSSTSIHVTQEEKDSWDNKAPGSHVHNVATGTEPGFMSSEDKMKLDSVANITISPIQPTEGLWFKEV